MICGMMRKEGSAVVDGTAPWTRNPKMPLLDHFHPPVSERRRWEGFHGLWAAALVERLNRDVLGEEYFADMQVHLSSQVEVDVATLEEGPHGGSGKRSSATATAVATSSAWAPPAAALVMPTVYPDDIEVQVFATTAGATLAAAIELVSPGNKDRPDTCRAFAAECVAYLTRGIGLIVVDIVTNRLANLHNEVVGLLGHDGAFLMQPAASLYAVAYRPSHQTSGDQIEMWPEPLAVGQLLPTLPLALRNAGVVPVDFEATYREACRNSRLDDSIGSRVEATG
jgi:hypothetical protein